MTDDYKGIEPDDLKKQFFDKIGHFDVEHFALAYLDADLKLLGLEDVMTGDKDSVAPQDSMVVERAKANNAKYIVAAHNHPVGTPRASVGDSIASLRLAIALEEADIKLADAYVVGRNGEVNSIEKPTTGTFILAMSGQYHAPALALAGSEISDASLTDLGDGMTAFEFGS